MALLILSASVFTDKMDKQNLKMWTIYASLFISIPLFLHLLAIGFGNGDEGIDYLFWNTQQNPTVDDLNQTSSIFSYNVNRSITDKSSRYALPPSEFYDIVAKMIPDDQMNLTETRKFLEKYNCNDRLSFPISFDPLLTPIGSLLGSSNSICV